MCCSVSDSRNLAPLLAAMVVWWLVFCLPSKEVPFCASSAVCLPGYTGQRCEEDVDECVTDPCHNGGICFERSNQTYYGTRPDFPSEFNYSQAAGFLCWCQPGFSGELPSGMCSAPLGRPGSHGVERSPLCSKSYLPGAQLPRDGGCDSPLLCTHIADGSGSVTNEPRPPSTRPSLRADFPAGAIAHPLP